MLADFVTFLFFLVDDCVDGAVFLVRSLFLTGRLLLLRGGETTVGGEEDETCSGSGEEESVAVVVSFTTQSCEEGTMVGNTC